MFSAGAEAVGGENGEPTYDAPYTWSLLGFDNNQAPCAPSPTCVTTVDRNAAAWRLFTAYLAYNFRGEDTTATLGAIHDDLLHKWAARTDRSLLSFRNLLADSSCYDCTMRTHLEGLSVMDRYPLLLHNWRVANYVNRSDLPGSEGQYGYPPQFGFTPREDVGAWQDIDGDARDDIVAIPPEVVLGSKDLTHEIKFYGERTTPHNVYPMVLQPLGAEYWIVRADSSLTQSGVDLAVSVSPESVFACGSGTGRFDGRLMASVVGYLPPDSMVLSGDLSANPQWAEHAVDPVWVEVDSLASELQLVLPGFGTTYRAAVIVISLADGPSQGLGNVNAFDYLEALPYRLTLALRTAPYQSPNPTAGQDSTAHDEQPAWSPGGDEIAFTVSDGSTSRVFRRSLAGGPATPLVSNGLSQFAPHWSPRGDRIVFTQSSTGPSLGDVYVLDLNTSQATKLTGNSGNEQDAVFSPNGQRLAYIRVVDPAEGPWQLRRIDLSGANDVLVVEADTALASPRWASDGSRVLFAKGQRLFSLRPDGTDLRLESFNRAVASFDVHPSGDSLVISEPGTIPLSTAGCWSAPNTSEAFQRIVVFDPLGDADPATWDDPTRFYRTGATFSDPRWSPDGTRIAYASDQNGSGDRDVFIGQVSYNHAPVWATIPQDVTITSCGPATLDLDATDPDGETVTYSAAYLPATASLNSSSGVFTWNPPLSGDHYITFRALDGSGGVAHRVVRISVPDNIRPDSLTVFEPLVTTNQAWISWYSVGDDSLTGTACKYEVRRNSVPITEANWSSSTHVSGTVPDPVPAEWDSLQSMWVTGLSPNTTYYIAMKVRDEAGDHWSKLSNVVTVHTSGGGCCLSARRSGPGEASAHGATAATQGLNATRTAEATNLIGSSQALAAEFSRGAGSVTWLVRRLGSEETSAIAAAHPDAQIVMQLQHGSTWSGSAEGSMGAGDSLLSLHEPAADRARFVFLGDHRLLVASEGAHGLAIDSAEHSRLGDLTEDLAPAAGEFEIDSDDWLRFTYKPATEETSPTAGFLTLRRVGTRNAAASRQPQGPPAPALPTAFALAQNQPNPFSSATTIRFDLPTSQQVRLEIFDAQGRRVARLANGWFPAGFHALEWDRRGEKGRLQPGVYLYRIQAGPFRAQKKLVLLP